MNSSLKTPLIGISTTTEKPLLCHKQLTDFFAMKKTGIFYGSSTGTCEDLATRIANKLGIASADVHSADKLTADLVNNYEVLILGTSTWGDGELQDDWYDAIKTLKSANLADKFVALFGCGDSESYCDTYCDGMGILYEDLKESGCTFIGNHVSTADYSFSSSIAVENGTFVGLALDEVNESDKTDARIDAWLADIKDKL